MASLRLVLFFTRGVSLRTWDQVGMFEREVAIYQRLQEHGVQMAFVTYGDASDLRYAGRIPGIRILCNRWGLSRWRYDALLADLAPVVRTPKVVDGATHVYQMYTIEVSENLRNPLLLYLRERGVGASVHFDPPVHRQPFYLSRGGARLELPVTDSLANSLITLPLYPDMTEEDQDYVVQCITEGLDEVQ